MIARRRNDSGSASIELAILLPTFAFLIVLAYLFGRTTVAQAAVDLAAHDAARAASLERNESDAKTAATDAAKATLTKQGTACIAIKVVPDTSGFLLPLGQPASVTVTVTCTVQLTDLGFSRNRNVSASFTSPIDQYRGR
jgi:Flp pilus assembly protein TadG